VWVKWGDLQLWCIPRCHSPSRSWHDRGVEFADGHGAVPELSAFEAAGPLGSSGDCSPCYVQQRDEHLIPVVPADQSVDVGGRPNSQHRPDRVGQWTQLSYGIFLLKGNVYFDISIDLERVAGSTFPSGPEINLCEPEFNRFLTGCEIWSEAINSFRMCSRSFSLIACRSNNRFCPRLFVRVTRSNVVESKIENLASWH